MAMNGAPFSVNRCFALEVWRRLRAGLSATQKPRARVFSLWAFIPDAFNDYVGLAPSSVAAQFPFRKATSSNCPTPSLYQNLQVA
ncbi:hypothetical protein AS890_15305 [Rhizobium anhuiense bv. trifolii]|nr:hypothetical protein AS890_15305 [Rhizobium anhuiense bv. trifolii]